MILITHEKSFCKRASKWAIEKDFLIADATEDYDGPVSDYGNRIMAVDFVPPPTLKKIARDPDSKEAKIKARNLNRYLELWLNDESLLARLVFFTDVIERNWDSNREDTNIFIVMKKTEYALLATPFMRYINETYGMDIAHLLTHKMDKETQKKLITMPVDESWMHRLSKMNKRLKKGIDKGRLQALYQEAAEG